jgi:hypothetical protein
LRPFKGFLLLLSTDWYQLHFLSFWIKHVEAFVIYVVAVHVDTSENEKLLLLRLLFYNVLWRTHRWVLSAGNIWAVVLGNHFLSHQVRFCVYEPVVT